MTAAIIRFTITVSSVPTARIADAAFNSLLRRLRLRQLSRHHLLQLHLRRCNSLEMVMLLSPLKTQKAQRKQIGNS